MRNKALGLVGVAVLALVLPLAAPASGAPGKPNSGAQVGAAGRAAAADAGVKNVAVSAAVSAAANTISSRIVSYVRANGTKYSFASYANATTGRVVVDTDAPAAVLGSLVGSYGALVDVRKRTISDNFHRRDDVPSFWGGNGIVLTAGVPRCSSGYTVQNGAGTRFMVTAGHCFTNGQVAVVEVSGLFVGNVSGNGLPSRDMELLSGSSYAPFIFVGGVTSTTGNHVASAADSVVGFANYCHSGRTTGEHCGHTSLSNTATVCTSSGCKANVTALTGGTQPQGGDSGSPLYALSAGTATDKHIRGHVIAGDGVTFYAEKWSNVANQYGVSIVT